MSWTSVLDGLPEEGVECQLSCMQADGSIVQMIGYLQDGKWVIEGGPEQLSVRQWKLFSSARKII